MIEKAPAKKPSDPTTSAILGAFLGALLVAVHLALDVSGIVPDCYLPLHPHRLHEGEPFLHVLTEFSGYGLAGAAVFGLAASLRNRLKNSRHV
jgi:hypothetical protein